MNAKESSPGRIEFTQPFPWVAEEILVWAG